MILQNKYIYVNLQRILTIGKQIKGNNVKNILIAQQMGIEECLGTTQASREIKKPFVNDISYPLLMNYGEAFFTPIYTSSCV